MSGLGCFCSYLVMQVEWSNVNERGSMGCRNRCEAVGFVEGYITSSRQTFIAWWGGGFCVYVLVVWLISGLWFGLFCWWILSGFGLSWFLFFGWLFFLVVFYFFFLVFCVGELVR